MLLIPFSNSWKWKYTNRSNTPGTTPGTAVTPGASNAEGSWTQVATSANIAYDVYLLEIWIGGGSTSGSQKNHLLDVGVDPAGGTSYTAIISNIVCGQTSNILTAHQKVIFPLFIKAGSSVAVRVQGSAATAGAVRIVVHFYGRPLRPEFARVGQYCETIGSVGSASDGVAFTPGSSGEAGSWTTLGTTTRPLWWIQMGVQVSNATITAQYTFVDLAVGDGTNKDIIIENLACFYGSTSEDKGCPDAIGYLQGAWEIPSGSTLYIRGHCSTTPASGYNALAQGIGG